MTRKDAFDVMSWLAKQGILAVMVGAMMWFIATQVVLPLREDQAKFVASLLETNRLHADAVQQMKEIQRQQSQQLGQIAELLREIRQNQMVREPSR